MPDIAFVNGRFLPLADAVISIEDRGFQFGDGVYEVIRTYRGRPFEVEAHLERLDKSSRALNLPQPYSHSRWKQLIDEAVGRSSHSEAKIYIQITRGSAPRDHAYSSDLVPTTVMTVRQLHSLDPKVMASGVEVVSTEDVRWGRCDIKSVNLLANVFARQQAKIAGAFEAILVKDGLVTEGAVSNVMAIQGGTLVTAPEGHRILSGVTRSVILRLAREDGFRIEERYLSISELRDADEVFLTGTTVEVLGVVGVDGKAIGSAKPGRLTLQLSKRFRDRIA
ncbi:D-alanine aminotransferase [Nitrospira sp. KM1]|uniref:D-amino-acid transaminase n=1 Tax=Nitrospira sp. KM1 TaxID=1936990 RepID=UPI0013A79C5D|nr:D-amino-acid transaminase [Nitrospira sp. KM1]BCA55012.1 D-alanine aminotransferase [Nitrospira sp. KM1]